MSISKRTLLIIEDDRLLNNNYMLFCEEVLKELDDLEKLPHIQGTVKQAFSYDQAKQILLTESVDFISVDIALSGEETGKTDTQRDKDEAGGINLLKQLQSKTRPPLAVVVSGETLQSYAIDAYQKYAILAFYQKARFNIEQYKHAVKAVLYYLEATELMEKPEIEAAAAYWEKTLDAAKVAGIREKSFPESVGQEIKERWTHPITNLPVGDWTEEKLKNRVVGRNDWALIRITLNGFNQFITAFASQEKPILIFAVNLFHQACQKYQNIAYDIGHLGYREQTSEPSFVIIIDQKGLPYVDQMAVLVEQEFKQQAGMFFSEFESDAEQQQLALTLNTKVLKSSEENFEDLHRLLNTLGQVKTLSSKL